MAGPTFPGVDPGNPGGDPNSPYDAYGNVKPGWKQVGYDQDGNPQWQAPAGSTAATYTQGTDYDGSITGVPGATYQKSSSGAVTILSRPSSGGGGGAARDSYHTETDSDGSVTGVPGTTYQVNDTTGQISIINRPAASANTGSNNPDHNPQVVQVSTSVSPTGWMYEPTGQATYENGAPFNGTGWTDGRPDAKAGASTSLKTTTVNGPKGFGQYVLNDDGSLGSFIGDTRAPSTASASLPTVHLVNNAGGGGSSGGGSAAPNVESANTAAQIADNAAQRAWQANQNAIKQASDAAEAERGRQFSAQELNAQLKQQWDLGGPDRVKLYLDALQSSNPARFLAFLQTGGGNIMNALAGGNTALGPESLLAGARAKELVDQQYTPFTYGTSGGLAGGTTTTGAPGGGTSGAAGGLVPPVAAPVAPPVSRDRQIAQALGDTSGNGAGRTTAALNLNGINAQLYGGADPAIAAEQAAMGQYSIDPTQLAAAGLDPNSTDPAMKATIEQARQRALNIGFTGNEAGTGAQMPWLTVDPVSGRQVQQGGLTGAALEVYNQTHPPATQSTGTPYTGDQVNNGVAMARGGLTREPVAMVGDARAHDPFAGGARPEVILNPTQAPLAVVPSPMVRQMGGLAMPRHATGTYANYATLSAYLKGNVGQPVDYAAAQKYYASTPAPAPAPTPAPTQATGGVPTSPPPVTQPPATTPVSVPPVSTPVAGGTTNAAGGLAQTLPQQPPATPTTSGTTGTPTTSTSGPSSLNPAPTGGLNLPTSGYGVTAPDPSTLGITPTDQSYMDAVAQLRAQTQVPTLNPFSADYSLQDPALRDAYEQALLSKYGIPVASTQSMIDRYQLKGVAKSPTFGVHIASGY